MAIPFTNTELYNGDGQMYFDGCTGFFYDDSTGKVKPFELCCESYYDEDEGEPLFVEVEHYARFLEEDRSREVLGHDLLCDPRYILSRFPLGYVPLEGGKKLVRITAQPISRRAAKGLVHDFIQYHPIAEVGGNGTLRSVLEHTRGPSRDVLCAGIAEVLTIGMPPIMRRNIRASVANSNARLAVRELFRNPDRVVCVPDFSVAIVKKRGSSDTGYVLYRGRLIGEARIKPDQTVTYVGYLKGKKDGTRPLIRKVQKEVTTRLFADRVTWSI